MVANDGRREILTSDRPRRERERKRERQWTTRLLLKNDGIQYRARVRRRGTAVSQTYKETTFALYFLYYRPRRLCVYARLCVGGRRKCILEKGNVSDRGRFVPADRSIGRDFKADCPYKVKNFSKSEECVYIYLHTRTKPVHVQSILISIMRRVITESVFYLSQSSSSLSSSFAMLSLHRQILTTYYLMM